MKILNIAILSTFTYLCVSCTKEDKPKAMQAPCVGVESLTDTISGFLIFDKGKQENGYAKGIKINKPFESSVLYFIYPTTDTVIGIQIKGYWPAINGHVAEAEDISFNRIPVNLSNQCLKLSANRNSKDSISASYIIGNDDVGILSYKLDISADNALEIISVDSASKKLKAKFKGTFIASKAYLPDLPKKVRFSDVYIEYGY